jgi:hypothetical protein
MYINCRLISCKNQMALGTLLVIGNIMEDDPLYPHESQVFFFEQGSPFRFWENPC